MVWTEPLIILTPLKQTPDHNVIRIHREHSVDEDRVHHIAGGNHTGIIINRLTDLGPDGENHVTLAYSVWINDGGTHKQECRTMFFSLYDMSVDDGRGVVDAFFRQLLNTFPRDYVSLMRVVMNMMKNGFMEIRRVDLDLRILAEDEQVAIPDAVQCDSGSEVDDLTAGLAQEVLEHAYPNGLTLEVIASSLRCTEEEAEQLLLELESKGIVQRVDNEWIRVDTRKIDAAVRGTSSAEHPTVAIISCLFVEKQAIDALLDDASTVHKYKSGGDSNVYTIGRMGGHRVVATKLAMIGNSREAITSAGSITTRLLGNFQHIEHVLIVGVGGAVPHYTDAKRHARLGDVVLSTRYVYAHDLVVDRHTDALKDFAVHSYLPSDSIMVSSNILQNPTESILTHWEEHTSEAIGRLTSTVQDVEFAKPSCDSDVLALSVGGGNVVVVPHPDPDRKNSRVHVGPIGAICSLKKVAEGENEEETASQIRQRFSTQFGLRSIDAGFDSVVAAIVGSRIDSWVLVRGIADYQHGQSRASKLWQAHAAVRAAAMARTIIERLPGGKA